MGTLDTQMMDDIKAVKSEYELELFTKSVKLHDDLMAAVPAFLRVGRTEREVANLIRNLANDMFCIFAHSQSYDIVDRPCWVAEETMELKENMFFAMHPTCANEEVSCYNCDNFVVTKDGGKKLSTTPGKIVVVDY